MSSCQLIQIGAFILSSDIWKDKARKSLEVSVCLEVKDIKIVLLDISVRGSMSWNWLEVSAEGQ